MPNFHFILNLLTVQLFFLSGAPSSRKGGTQGKYLKNESYAPTLRKERIQKRLGRNGLLGNCNLYA